MAAVNDCMWKKADLSKGYQNPQGKLGVTTQFSVIIELKFEKKAIHSWYFKAYRITVVKLYLKNAWLPTFFFLDSNNPC